MTAEFLQGHERCTVQQ